MAIDANAQLANTVEPKSATSIIELDGPLDGDDIRGSVFYLLDESRELGVMEALKASNTDQFQVLQTGSADFGYTKSAIWLRFDVVGRLSHTSDWRLHFRENFKQEFDVYRINEDGVIETIMALDMQSPFSARPIAYPELVAPFVVNQGEVVTIMIRLWSEGASHLPINIETSDSFASVSGPRAAKNLVSYGMLAALFLAAIISAIVFRSSIFVAYSLYSGSAVLFIMHGDGAAFQYLWPNSPAFNSYVSVLLGAGLILGGSTFARIFLQTKRFHPIMDMLLKLLILITLSMLVASFFMDNQPIKQGLVLLALGAVLLFAASGLVAARTRFKEVRFYVLAWLGAVLVAIVMNLRHHFGIEISQDFQHDGMRVVFVLDAMMMGLAIIDRYNQLRVARHRAVRRSLDQAEHNLSLTRRLENLEQQYALASDLAADKDRALVDTIHDLRQPLYALRLNIRSLVDSQKVDGTQSAGGAMVDDGNASRASVEETFAYLENLVSGHLEAGRKNKVESHVGDAPPSRGNERTGVGELQGHEDRVEDLALGEILESIHQMFKADAEAKGLEFRFVPTTLKAQVEPLVLMRIVSNLVANAIKYTDNGKVLLGCRRKGDKVIVEVHDTGSGMSREEFETAKQREVRLPGKTKCMPAGNGYGLAIVNKLAELNRLDFTQIACPPDRNGTSLSIALPRVLAKTRPTAN